MAGFQFLYHFGLCGGGDAVRIAEDLDFPHFLQRGEVFSKA